MSARDIIYGMSIVDDIVYKFPCTCKKCGDTRDRAPVPPDFACRCEACGAVAWKPSPKQKAFILGYAGNGSDAARRAGYKGNMRVMSTAAARLMKDNGIVAAIKNKDAKKEDERLLTRNERLLFWQKMMNNAKQERDQIAASKLLGQAHGDFLTRVDLSAEIAVTHRTDDEVFERVAKLLGLGGK